MNEHPPIPSADWCEDEIDLRELTLTLWRGKWVIVLTTLLAAVVALAVSLLLPKQYQAEADITLAHPRLQFKAAEGLVLEISPPDLKTVAAIAQAPEMFQRLATDEAIQATWSTAEGPLTWQRLASKAEVKEQGESGLQFSIKDTDPQRAVLLTNHWANLVVTEINEHYGWAAIQAQLTSQAKKAQQAYKEAEKAYEQEVSRNQGTTLSAQLKHAEGDLNCVLALQSQLKRLQADTLSFAAYLANLEDANTLSPGDALSLATLQQRALATKVCVSDTTNLQVQWPTETLTSLTVAQARYLLKELDGALGARLKPLPEQQKSLETKILHLKQAIEEEGTRLKEVAQQRSIAWKTYTSLEQLRSQTQPLTSSENQVALVAAEAVKPERPIAPRKLMNTALAAVLGLFLGSIGIFIREWWTNEENETEGENED